MNDIEFLRYAFKGNDDAVGLVMSVVKIADIWDNLIDGDKEVSKQEINEAFWLACIEVPRNPVFRQYQLDITAVCSTGILNWHVANQLQTGDDHAKQIAHVTRYSIADVSLYLAAAIGGPEWAIHVGPELRIRSQKDRLENFLEEMKNEK
jgi:hypothetical protein